MRRQQAWGREQFCRFRPAAAQLKIYSIQKPNNPVSYSVAEQKINLRLRSQGEGSKEHGAKSVDG